MKKVILLFVFVSITIAGFAQESGTAGALSWHLSLDRVLTISGNGGMRDFQREQFYGDAWHTHRKIIEKVVIEEGVTSIGKYAFYLCTKLTSVELPGTLTRIEKGAFENCGITSLSLPNSINYIGESAFSACRQLTSVNIPDQVEKIEYNTFASCSSLSSILIPGSVKIMGTYAFSDCVNLTSVEIEEGLTTIGFEAFAYCSRLTLLNIPMSVTRIENYAFAYSGLTSITIPKSVNDIGLAIFRNCEQLQTIHVENDNPHFSSVDGVLFNKDQTKIAYYPIRHSGSSYIVPDQVKVLGNECFSDSKLSSIILHDQVEVIEDGVFSSCANLLKLRIPKSVTKIEKGSFGFSSLKELIVEWNTPYCS